MVEMWTRILRYPKETECKSQRLRMRQNASECVCVCVEESPVVSVNGDAIGIFECNDTHIENTLS